MAKIGKIASVGAGVATGALGTIMQVLAMRKLLHAQSCTNVYNISGMDVANILLPEGGQISIEQDETTFNLSQYGIEEQDRAMIFKLASNLYYYRTGSNLAASTSVYQSGILDTDARKLYCFAEVCGSLPALTVYIGEGYIDYHIGQIGVSDAEGTPGKNLSEGRFCTVKVRDDGTWRIDNYDFPDVHSTPEWIDHGVDTTEQAVIDTPLTIVADDTNIYALKPSHLAGEQSYYVAVYNVVTGEVYAPTLSMIDWWSANTRVGFEVADPALGYDVDKLCIVHRRPDSGPGYRHVIMDMLTVTELTNTTTQNWDHIQDLEMYKPAWGAIVLRSHQWDALTNDIALVHMNQNVTNQQELATLEGIFTILDIPEGPDIDINDLHHTIY